MAYIRLTGKYAVGVHEFALVDDDMLEYLSRWKWKAKPNGGRNNVYAVRNARENGRNVTIRMHRVVVGMDASNPLDVDHDNHNSLDNRRVNLIPSTRSMNIANARSVKQMGRCKHCSAGVERVISACVKHAAMMCDRCRTERRSRPRNPTGPYPKDAQGGSEDSRISASAEF
ncbi:hypothetical protein [Burkholderia cenocepacia]|uniref:hypothetical protein n=1 Tax=Burkholderia cenocepacia TaxID=95486 RepID=UPI002AB6DB41|nr:hypothetical protein [Burkholderia cenocepacia]